MERPEIWDNHAWRALHRKGDRKEWLVVRDDLKMWSLVVNQAGPYCGLPNPDGLSECVCIHGHDWPHIRVTLSLKHAMAKDGVSLLLNRIGTWPPPAEVLDIAVLDVTTARAAAR